MQLHDIFTGSMLSLIGTKEFVHAYDYIFIMHVDMKSLHIAFWNIMVLEGGRWNMEI